jgi:hypothetical protein
MPKHATGPPDVAMCEIERSLVMGVKVEVKGMGLVNWAPAAPMNVTIIELLEEASGAGSGDAKAEVARRRRGVMAERMVVVRIFVVG